MPFVLRVSGLVRIVACFLFLICSYGATGEGVFAVKGIKIKLSMDDI
jgi:hypothetical protein